MVKWSQRVGNALFLLYGVGLVAAMVRLEPRLETWPFRIFAGMTAVVVTYLLARVLLNWRHRVAKASA